MNKDNKTKLFNLLCDLQAANYDYICALTAAIEYLDDRIDRLDELSRDAQ
jgi:hypothetical protein